MRYAACFLLLTAVASAAQPDEAPRDESLKGVVKELAEKVRADLHSNNCDTVRIGAFTGMLDLRDFGAGGGSIASLLELELGKHVSTTAKVELSGKLFYVDDPDVPNNKTKVIRISAELNDAAGAGISVYKNLTFIKSASDIGKITGANVTFKDDDQYPNGIGHGRRKDIEQVLYNKQPEKKQDAAYKPQVKPADDTILVGKSASVQILSSADLYNGYKPLKITHDKNHYHDLPGVAIPLGHYYQVKVINRDKCEIAVQTAIDGVDQFHFSEDRKDDGSPKFSAWIVDHGKDVLIKGWHQNAHPGQVFSFVTTKIGGGAVRKLPQLPQDKIGTITVGIALTADINTKGAKGDKMETAQGPSIEVKQQVVQRKIEKPHEFLSIRYSH